jgi:hypothetical protein
MNDPTQICRGFTDVGWKRIQKKLNENDQRAWAVAIEVFERRMKERFLTAIDVLIANDSKNDVTGSAEDSLGWPILPNDNGMPVIVPGFAIMGLCCLFAETLQSFREKTKSEAPLAGKCSYPSGQCIRPGTTMTDQFKQFLRRPAFHGEFDDDKIAMSFVRGVRNGILHEAETRSWAIWRDEPHGKIVERRGDGYAVNRSNFCLALKSEFETYVHELRDASNDKLRKRFIKKMTDIADEC